MLPEGEGACEAGHLPAVHMFVLLLQGALYYSVGAPAQVAEWLPEAEGAGEEGELPATLAGALRPGALSEYEKALAAVFVAGAEVRP